MTTKLYYTKNINSKQVKLNLLMYMHSTLKVEVGCWLAKLVWPLAIGERMGTTLSEIQEVLMVKSLLTSVQIVQI